MKPYLLELLADPKTKNRLQLLEPVYAGEEIIGGVLFDDISKKTYPIKNGVPHFTIDLEAQASLGIAGINYLASADPRAKWKNVVRRYPTLTRFLQFVFDPAYVSHSTRNKFINSLSGDPTILNIGAGVKRFGDVRCVNLDLEEYGNVDVVADAQGMPFIDSSFDAVLLKYVVEHIPDSSRLVAEIHTVLRPGGYVYATVPFMQAYHGNPDDYYRFTISGFQEFWRDFECVECKPFGGPTSALITMIKEYLAILFSFNSKTVYSILSQLLIIPLFPLKYVDVFLVKSKNAHNIAFSIVFLGRKPKLQP